MIRRKKIMVLSVALLALLGFTGSEYFSEPPSWHATPYYGKHYWGGAYIAYPLEAHSNLSFSEFGNAVDIGYQEGAFVGTQVLNLTGYYGPLGIVAGAYWVESLRLAFPYTGFSFYFDSLSLTVNGSLLKNVTYSHDYNVLPYMWSGYSINHNTTLYYSGCEIPNDYQKPMQDILNTGNYTFNYTVVLTPVFEIGPYWVKGPRQEISFKFVILLIT